MHDAVGVSNGAGLLDEKIRQQNCAAPAVPEDDLPVTVIERRPGWRFIDLDELWRYRELLWFLTWRDIKVRYKQTALGAAWAIIQPLFTMLVFSLFFGRLAKIPSEPVRMASLTSLRISCGVTVR